MLELEQYGLEMTTEMKGCVKDMGSLSDWLVEESEERGERRGEKRGIILKQIQLVIKKVKKDKNLSEIADELEDDEKNIKLIYDIVLANAPEYDEYKIYNELNDKKNIEES